MHIIVKRCLEQRREADAYEELTQQLDTGPNATVCLPFIVRFRAQMSVEEWELESFLERNQRRSRGGYREQGTINGSQASGSTWHC